MSGRVVLGETPKTKGHPQQVDVLISGLRESLKIDKHNLDEDLVRQPILYETACCQYARSVSQRDGLKNELTVLLADVGLEIRQRFSDSGEKITESGVTSRIESDPRVVNLRSELQESQRDLEEWSGLVQAYLQRSHVLHDLVVLYGNQYFMKSSASVPVGEGYERNKSKLSERRKNSWQKANSVTGIVPTRSGRDPNRNPENTMILC